MDRAVGHLRTYWSKQKLVDLGSVPSANWKKNGLSFSTNQLDKCRNDVADESRGQLDAPLSARIGCSPQDAVENEATSAIFMGEADFTAAVTIFDSKGQVDNLIFLFARTGATAVKYQIVADSNKITGGTAGDLYPMATEGTLEFNVDATLNSATGTLTDITLANLSNGSSDITIAAADLSFSSLTQIAQPSAVFSLAQTNRSGMQAQLGRLDAALDQVSLFRSEIGSRLNGAQTASTAITTLQDHTIAQRSSIEDAEVLSASSDFARLQQAFLAALQSAAQVIQPSLFEFLK